MTTFAEAIQRAGAVLAGGYADVYCPNGSGEEQERLAAHLERVQHEAAGHTPAGQVTPAA